MTRFSIGPKAEKIRQPKQTLVFLSSDFFSRLTGRGSSRSASLGQWVLDVISRSLKGQLCFGDQDDQSQS